MMTDENGEDRAIASQTGRCACGAVKVIANVPKTFGVCHCHSCRRWTGGVWMGVLPVAPPEISGPVACWKSSNIADRGFCRECGSSIWHRPFGTNRPTLGQGLFDDQTGWTMARQICFEEKPDHYEFGTSAPAFTGWGTIVAFLTGRLPK